MLDKSTTCVVAANAGLEKIMILKKIGKKSDFFYFNQIFYINRIFCLFVF